MKLKSIDLNEDRISFSYETDPHQASNQSRPSALTGQSAAICLTASTKKVFCSTSTAVTLRSVQKTF